MVNFNAVNIIGLTGMSGAGKSTVSRAFERHGVYVVDCDTVARGVIIRSPCVDEVRVNFPEVFTNRIFDRKKAAKFLFSDSEKLMRYQQIVFPYVVFAILREIAACKSDTVLLDAPTLFQSGADDFCDKLVAVVADRGRCIRRIIERDSIGEHDAVMRLRHQPDEAYFRENCDYVIENNEDNIETDEFRQKIDDCYKSLNHINGRGGYTNSRKVSDEQ
jgi:dephospho-CoA kinase